MTLQRIKSTAGMRSAGMAICLGLLLVPVLAACDTSKSSSSKKVDQAIEQCKEELQNRAASGEFGSMQNSNEKQAFEDAYWQCVDYTSSH